MHSDDSDNARIRQLRAAAEALAEARPKETATRPTAELLHELQVHQIELEIQNEILRQAQIELEESRDRFVDLYEFAPVGYLSLTPEGLISEINLTAVGLLGVDRKKLLHKSFRSLVLAPDRDRWVRHFMGVKNGNAPSRTEIQMKRGDGSVFHVQLDCAPGKTGAGMMTTLRLVLTDITLRKAAEDKIQTLAYYDPLTGLPNRRLLTDRLHQALAASIRRRRRGALLFVDLDHFKDVNDTLGHAEGDLMLDQTARRLHTCVREGDTVARLGGDEFVVLLEDLSDSALEAAVQAKSVGEKILDTFSHDYQLVSGPRRCSASVGVALFGEKVEASADGPLKRADLAMYQAKEAGRNTLLFFDEQVQAVITARAALESDLSQALEQGQFVLHYQPQVSLQTGALTGVEALTCWQRADGQLMSPEEFIPAAERTKLILPIGQWVIEEVCRQLRQWREARMPELKVAINVTAHQFVTGDLDTMLSRILQENDVAPHCLEIELTESALMADPAQAVAMLGRIKATGVSLSLDDFGTGYSSLADLSRFPVNALKIDRSFVRDMMTEPHAATIALAIIDLAHRMHLKVVAEGVETDDQLEFLRKHGCDQMQGYLFSRPLPEPALRALLLEGKTLPPGQGRRSKPNTAAALR